MNKIYLLAFLGLTLSCNQNKGSDASSEDFSGYPPNAEILAYTDSPGLEKVTVMFADKIEMQGDYLNGKRNGTWTEYHGNEVVKSITTFVNGQQHGIAIEMDDRGNLTKKAFYHKGQYDGDFTYFKSGKMTEKRYYLNGVLNGELSKFYTSGKIMEQSNYQNGQIHGTAKWYDQDGNVTIEYEYENGELIESED